jgi:transcriptional regulator with XRE-family HTH domain
VELIADELNTEVFIMLTEEGKVVFEEAEQKEIDRIVSERLTREKSKYVDYDDLKEIEAELEEFGYTGTPAEKKAAIKAYKESLREQSNYQEEIEHYANDGEIPDEKVLNALAKKFGVPADKVEKAIKKVISIDEAEEKKQKDDEAWDKQVKAFEEKYETVDIGKLAEDKKFIKFAKGKGLPLVELYEEYLDFLGDSEKEFTAKIQANIDRSTSSGKQKGDALGGTYGLSADEQELAKENGMTMKEYSERKNRRSV